MWKETTIWDNNFMCAIHALREVNKVYDLVVAEILALREVIVVR